MNRFLILISFLYFNGFACFSQAELHPILWYNCENLFHPSNDSLKSDEVYTPEGACHWTYKKYRKKVQDIAKVLLNISGWDRPAIIGLCEIENEQCIKDLVYNSPLDGINLNYLHKESDDRRGIDVALLYNPKSFEPVQTRYLKLVDPEQKEWRSRDILYTKGLYNKRDTLHVFVNHWPSKYGGAVASESKRKLAAHVFISTVDSIRKQNPQAKILALGDFNETANEPALQLVSESGLLLLQSNDLHSGSHKFQGNWSQIDYFIHSKTLDIERWYIAKPAFVLESDESYQGTKPFRTNNGYRYNGGFSDHLPLVLYLKNPKQ